MLSRTLLVASLFLISGCFLDIQVPVGGRVESLSGRYACFSGQICRIDIEDASFQEDFQAVPDAGYSFTGWQQVPRSFCGGATGACRITTLGLDAFPTLASFFSSDEVFFLVPTFEQAQSQLSLFGVGGTSGLFASGSAVAEVSSQLRGSNLSRDPTQLPPSGAEQSALAQMDFLRSGSVALNSIYSNSLSFLINQAGLSSRTPLRSELDMRFNPVMGSSAGGHAGHDYVFVDGRFIDMMNEIANYYAVRDTGFATEFEVSAIDRIVFFQNNNVGGSSFECCYSLSALSSRQRELSDYYFRSMLGAIAYHEFGHYYLLHSLDFLRSQFDLTGLVQFSSVNEDDADFIAGFLSAKAGLSLEFGQFMYDLMFYYANQRQGLVFTILDVVNNPFAQLYSLSSNYSPLSVRKQNFARGYAAY